MACSLSRKIVYREGITYLEELPLTYLRGERLVRHLIDEVRASNLASSEKLAELLELGGARTLAQSFFSAGHGTGE